MSAPLACPACYQRVPETAVGMFAPHWDTAGNKCEGEELPYRCAITLNRNNWRAA